MNNQVKLIRVGETKTAKDNRQFYTAEFQDASNPFAKAVSRNFWQQFNAAGEPVWKGADPVAVKPFIGKTLPGQIITAKVEEYSIPRAGKDDYIASTYTTVVLGGELQEVVFSQLGHKMVQAEVVATPAATEELEVA